MLSSVMDKNNMQVMTSSNATVDNCGTQECASAPNRAKPSAHFLATFEIAARFSAIRAAKTSSESLPASAMPNACSALESIFSRWRSCFLFSAACSHKNTAATTADG